MLLLVAVNYFGYSYIFKEHLFSQVLACCFLRTVELVAGFLGLSLFSLSLSIYINIRDQGRKSESLEERRNVM